jgi:ribonuclease J
MRVCIARGAAEIGGSCVLVRSAAGTTVALDLGLPLDAEQVDVSLPDALREARPQAALVSHAHPDHYGMIDALGQDVPVYMGEATAAILKEAAFFTPLGLDREAEVFRDRSRFRIGDIEITPFLVDHSAFDSYAFLVEADGHSLFYSGDIRAHGRKSALFDRLLADPPRADALLLEGTTISRTPEPSTPTAEDEVEQRCIEVFRRTGGMALACYSPQNIDRLVSVYRAALRSDRNLVLDLYAASIAAATGRDSIPQGDWERIRVYVPQAQRIRVKRSRQFTRVEELGSSRIYAEELAVDPSHWVMTFRGSIGPELARAGCLRDAEAVWLMWPGYLDREPSPREWFDSNQIPLTVAHASGHASVKDLQRLARAIAAKKVVPIHTDAAERFATLFENVERRADGEWWEVG